MENKNHRRVCVSRMGWAIVPGDTDEAALEYAKNNLTASDFDWEPVNPSMLADALEIVEACGPNGEI